MPEPQHGEAVTMLYDRVKPFLSAVFAGTTDNVRLLVDDAVVEVSDDLDIVLIEAGLATIYFDTITLSNNASVLYSFADNAQPDQWRDHSVQPTAVLFKDGGLICIYALEEAVARSQEIDALADAMNGFLDDPLPTPGAEGWELIHFDDSIFHPIEVLKTAWMPAKPVVGLPRYGDAVVKAPYDESDPQLQNPITVTVGANSKSTHWKPTTMPLGGFVAMLSQHKVGAKDGMAWVLGDMVGGMRNIKAVKSLTAVGLDIDTGMSSEAIDAELAKLGCLAIRYTTHSHMRGQIEVPKDTIGRWLEKARSPVGDLTDDQTIRDFLHDFKKYEREVADTASFAGWEHTDKGIVAKIDHAPMPKNRVVLPLAKPFIIADEGQTQKDAETKWRKIPAALAAQLGGIPLDKTGSDPNRLFYLPRHAKNAEFEIALFGGPCFDWTDLELDDPFETVAVEMSQGRSKSTTDAGKGLGRWFKRCGHGFQLADLIRDHAADRVRSDSNSKMEIECPFDDHHSNAGDPEDRACLVVNAGEGAGEFFTAKCRHDSCQERTVLDMVGKMLTEGWFAADVLDDPNYNALDDEVPSPPPAQRMAGGVAINGVLDGLEAFNPRKKYFSGPKAADDAIDALSKVASVVKMGNKMRIVIRGKDGLGFSTESEAKLYFAPYRAELEVGATKDGPKFKEVPALDLLLKSDRRKTWQGIDCDPSNSLPDHVLNTWEGTEIAPAPGDCSLLKAHILNSMCAGNAEHAHYLTQWFAHMFQKPKEKPGVAPVVIGPKGCGKSTVADILRLAIGRKHSVKIAQAKHLTGNFNAHLGGMLLVQAEEVTFGGDKKGEGPLKDAITAKTMLTERKGLDAYQETNFARFFLVSNPGHAVPASDGERRWLVLHARDLFAGKPMNDPGRIAYFDALYKEAAEGGVAAFLDYLLTYPLEGFTPFAAPDTHALADQVRQSLSDEDQWMMGVLETGLFDTRDGEITSDDWEMDEPLVVECSAVQASFNSHVRRFGGSSGGAGAVRKVLESHGSVERCQKRGQLGRTWNYVLGGRREWRERFSGRFGISFDDEA